MADNNNTMAGTPIWWCEEHRSEGSKPIDGYSICWYYGNAVAMNPRVKIEPCRMVEVELHPVGTHAEIARTRAFFDPDGEVDDVEVV